MGKTYWFVSYHTGTIGFDSAFIEINSRVFDYSNALSELRRKKGINDWQTNIIYFREVTEEEYELNKHM
ncbi:MAG: hypothetical protein ACRDD8_11905 [Bacteroidales bacterium]